MFPHANYNLAYTIADGKGRRYAAIASALAWGNMPATLSVRLPQPQNALGRHQPA